MSGGKTRGAGGAFGVVPGDGPTRYERGSLYRVPVYLTLTGGVWTAAAAILPGVSAAGATEGEALAAVEQAAAAEIARHKENGGKIPWTESPPPPGALVRWLFISPETK